ncbi:MAG: hypothetical protein ABF391_14385 [Akkermansiaceae bacterium]
MDLELRKILWRDGKSHLIVQNSIGPGDHRAEQGDDKDSAQNGQADPGPKKIHHLRPTLDRNLKEFHLKLILPGDQRIHRLD